MKKANSNPPTHEKRLQGRIQLEKEVQITFNDYRSFATSFAENISEGGMFLRTKSPIPANTILRFRLKIKDIDQEIAGRAIVVWTKEVPNRDHGEESGMGLKFLELEETSSQFIRDFVNRHAATES